MVHLVPCRRFLYREHGWIQNRFERMRTEGAGRDGHGGEQGAQKRKQKRSSRVIHNVLRNDHCSCTKKARDSNMSVAVK